MLKSISLTNFKCFPSEQITLAPLVVLSGVNGMGKSTVLQSILLLRQSILSGTLKTEGALLNGPLVSFGTSDDVFYENAEKNEIIKLELQNESNLKESYNFKYEQGKRILCNEYPASCENIGETLSDKSFYYLCAERTGPRTSFARANYEMTKYNQIGNTGENCAHLLSQNERSPLGTSELLHQNEELDELRLQVEAWLSEIGQSPRIHLNDLPNLDITGMEFSFVFGNLPSMKYRATNVGFGLTYSLPIFASVLHCKPGGLILIENPEAHLHPKGQVAMGKFLAKAAASGIQIIIETHSDHILNGIRIAVKSGELTPGDLALHFFDRKKGESNSNRISPNIDKDGRLDQWPNGFFDEWEKGLTELL